VGILVVFVLVFLALVAISAVANVTFGLLLPVFVWMLVGMFAGRILRGRGYGPVGDVLLGLAGGIVGSLLFGLLGVNLGGILGYMIVGIVGAILFIYAVRALGNAQFAR
jgi:uncharacterized membrane protein YeaQ/YmgE (transglycosylase-associated protein family)